MLIDESSQVWWSLTVCLIFANFIVSSRQYVCFYVVFAAELMDKCLHLFKVKTKLAEFALHL